MNKSQRITPRRIPEGSFSEGFYTAVRISAEWLLENLGHIYEGSRTTDELFVRLYEKGMEERA